MKLNISYPTNWTQKTLEFDETKVRPFFDKRISHEVPADSLGDEWKGYVLRISGGNDLQGFPMKQGVLSFKRVQLLMSKGHSTYRRAARVSASASRSAAASSTRTSRCSRAS